MVQTSLEEYREFVDRKSETSLYTDSIQLDADDLNPKLYSFQRDIVRWALAKGRAAIFADCGLGKTPMQLEWANQIVKARGGDGADSCSPCGCISDCRGGHQVRYRCEYL